MISSDGGTMLNLYDGLSVGRLDPTLYTIFGFLALLKPKITSH